MPKVEKSLMYLQVEEKLEEYAITDLDYVCIAKMDPSKMNEPVTRRRLYILLIRKTLSCTVGLFYLCCISELPHMLKNEGCLQTKHLQRPRL